MLTPGDAWIAVAGTGQEASKFWNAFFNPTYWPSLFLRSCVCASLAGVWALITSSRIDADKQPALKTSMVKWSVKWLVPSFVAMPFLMIWYYTMVPASQQALLTLGIDTINAGTFSAVTRMALVIIVTSATIIRRGLLPGLSQPLDFNLSHAMSVLLLALIATGAGEYSREMLRKPYVIGRWMYSNGVARSLRQSHQPGRLSGPVRMDLERRQDRLAVELLPRRSDLPRRMRIVPHPGRLPSTANAACRRDRANIASFITMLHGLQARLALPPLHAAHGGHQAGRGRPGRVPECAGESSGAWCQKSGADGAEIAASIDRAPTAKARNVRAFAVCFSS